MSKIKRAVLCALALIFITALFYIAFVFNEEKEFYTHNNYVFKADETLNLHNVDRFSSATNEIYETHIKGVSDNYYVSVIPDKAYFAKDIVPNADAKEIAESFASSLTGAKYIDIFSDLSLESYYKTDPHWSQDKLLPVCDSLFLGMGLSASDTIYQDVTLEPFFGTYKRQSPTDMGHEELVYLNSIYTETAEVNNLEKPEFNEVYDLEGFYSNDGYNLFLSGATAFSVIENEHAKTDKELIIFRDSFASSLAPLLLENYKSISLVDLRYFQTALLGDYVDFENKDVLVLYSTTILNSNIIFR